MSYYFREKPRIGERFRGKSGDEVLKEFQEHFDKSRRHRGLNSGSDEQHHRPSVIEEEPGGGCNDHCNKSDSSSNHSGDSFRDRFFERHKSAFPRGFPFEDDGFGRHSSDIRSHLNDLAARHPEFADHLLGPPWADAPPFGSGTLRSRRRPPPGPTSAGYNSTANNATHNHHLDDDVRSQCSSGSAASGASGVSSHGDPADHHIGNRLPTDNYYNDMDINNEHQQIPSEQHNARNQRSMSAPPENRNQQQDPLNPRFVSRVDITPQSQNNNNNQHQQQSPQSPQQQQQQQQQQQSREKSPAPQKPTAHHHPQYQSSTVRQIPIFVEGRDKPVIARDHTVDEPDYAKRQQSPPHFTKPSAHFHQPAYEPSTPPQWSSRFNDPFFDHPANRWSRHQKPESPPTARHHFQHPTPSTEAKHHFQQHTPETKRTAQQHQQQQQQQQHTPHPTQHHRPAQTQPPQSSEKAAEPPKQPTKPPLPKDPLERVALVQNEVDSLNEQVKQFSGNSRKDKQYIYLDEMLTRELIKLDDIDTEGKENVRMARKRAIKSIQDSISLLESKAPLPGQQPVEQESQLRNEEKTDSQTESAAGQTDEKKEEIVENNQSCSMEVLKEEKGSDNSQDAPQAMDTSELQSTDQQRTQDDKENKAIPLPGPNHEAIPLPAPAEKSTDAMDVSRRSPVEEIGKNNERKNSVDQKQIDGIQFKELTVSEPVQETVEQNLKSAKSPKKAKKSKKQAPPAPISETPIPLPAPEAV